MNIPEHAQDKLAELSKEYSSIPQLEGWESRKESSKPVEIETKRHKEIRHEMWKIRDLYADKTPSPQSNIASELKQRQKDAIERAMKQARSTR
jgi:hypothetical protein